MTNLNLAFDIAEQHLDIPKMLDAEGKNRLRSMSDEFNRKFPEIYRLDLLCVTLQCFMCAF